MTSNFIACCCSFPQSQASTVELEKLRTEHARCKEQFEQQQKRINTLAEQIEGQSDEILAIKWVAFDWNRYPATTTLV